MSFSFNSGGLITRGYGDDNKIITRGMGVRFEFGGPLFKRESKEYFLDVLTPVSKENFEERKIYSPLEIRINGELYISSMIYKALRGDLKILANIDHSRLSEVLDAI